MGSVPRRIPIWRPAARHLPCRPVRSLLALAAAAILACARPPAPQPVDSGELPLGTPAQAESLLADVRALAPSIRVDLRYRDAGNFTGAPLPGYEANRAFLRREAAAALARVQRRAEGEGATLLVWDAYRPVRATLAMVEWTRRTGREDLVRDGYIAARSRHNLGMAIDLTLADAAGNPLDMGTAFDTFSTAAHTDSATGQVMANRARLRRIMEAEGFRNYAQEWWHFSYAADPPIRFDVPVR